MTLFTLPSLAAVAALLVVINIWLTAVNANVKEPYLDEFFHVGQAQRYIAGQFYDWDPKITTPPGLYLISTALAKVVGLDSVAFLRITNVLLLPILLLLVVDLNTALSSARSHKRGIGKPKASQASDVTAVPVDFHSLHTAFNICLFPPLFFFSALYYTDVASTVSVLACWDYTVLVNHRSEPGISQDVVTTLLGLLSLTFRQTNIFWVSIFPATMLFVSKIDASSLNKPKGAALIDPLVDNSSVDDYLCFGISLVKRSLQGVFETLKGNTEYLFLVRSMVPYLFILATFVAFVAWNGGVVLGDKSNHVATIHLAQLLYLWPYINFFSIPLTYPYLLQVLSSIPGLQPPLHKIGLVPQSRPIGVLPRSVVALSFLAIAVLIVRLNTIVHPFTLADNRHYTFYVFRILRQHPAIKYLATPAYVVTAWSTIRCLGGLAPPRSEATRSDGIKTQMSEQRSVHTRELIEDRSLRLNNVGTGNGSTISYLAIWLGTSALQLATAPLVEPRYFILPWLFWRLQVPRIPNSTDPEIRVSAGTRGAPNRPVGSLRRSLWLEHDRRLWLETAWFLAINAITGYAFLYKGFAWAQEPGKVQRFMW